MPILSEELGLHIEGWMQFPELVWLFAAAQQVESVVEIGSWKGRSTCALLSGCKGAVHAVDHWRGSEAERSNQHKEAAQKDVHAEFFANVGHFPNLVEHRMASAEASATIASADLVFIDGGHQYQDVLDDIALWHNKATKILCGHDYDWPGVKRAVHDCFGDRVCNPIGNIWSVPVDAAFARGPAHAFLFGGNTAERTGGDTGGDIADFELLLRAASDDVLARLSSGWVLQRTPNAATETAPVDRNSRREDHDTGSALIEQKR